MEIIVNEKNHKTFVRLNSIDSKEIAYLIGFIAADGNIDHRDHIELSVGIKDKEILEFFSEVFKTNLNEDLTKIKRTRRFPRIRSTRKIIDIRKFLGGRLKEERSLPRVRIYLLKYLILGFFDADGCITWGRRRDRNRLWYKVSFTSSYKLLLSLQKILIEQVNISSIIRPKKGENCFVLEFSSKTDVLKFLEYIYADKTFVILKRKFDNYNALRLELGEFGETTKSTIPSQATDHSVEGVETTGGKMGSLNNQLERPRQLKLF